MGVKISRLTRHICIKTKSFSAIKSIQSEPIYLMVIHSTTRNILGTVKP